MAKWRATVSQLLESVCQPVDPKEAASDGARCQLPSVATVEELVQYANHVKVELKELRKLKQVSEWRLLMIHSFCYIAGLINRPYVGGKYHFVKYSQSGSSILLNGFSPI